MLFLRMQVVHVLQPKEVRDRDGDRVKACFHLGEGEGGDGEVRE